MILKNLKSRVENVFDAVEIEIVAHVEHKVERGCAFGGRPCHGLGNLGLGLIINVFLCNHICKTFECNKNLNARQFNK